MIMDNRPLEILGRRKCIRMYKSEDLPEFVNGNSVRTEYVIFILSRSRYKWVFIPFTE